MRRIIVALTGASGAVYGIRALELLREVPDVETHLVLTKAARATIGYETDHSVADVRALADVVHSDGDLGAPISSGSFRTAGMLVAPCSVKTLSGIAASYDESLVVRAADVVLKERRRLVLLLRETPLHAGHLRLMSEVTASGAIVMPPVPAFYAHPHSVADIVEHTTGRALDLLDVDTDAVARWTGERDGRAVVQRS
ncbi:UbiX family flavin prenyltransferase [Pseudonocardia alni]|jgi:4-hydroxy-3-polyprenylbenzoate decarboxylase|uniref:UbiX family flavin prenyltransferase n=1 Tax=Pseudonocardia alni TaxID=33907 RepID=UPI0006CB4506|nr:UbiX family flavin prenyltransferase [Pseudonocardia sp. AL041005-10]ALE78427.1 3-octaprenyl-4-hydroxybenzoate carboxy-lyase [Pseudonocardia sp. AL041005-10]